MNNETMLALICTLLYLLVALSAYSKLKAVIKSKAKELDEDLLDGVDDDHKEAVAKTSIMIAALFWPISFAVSKILRGAK